MSASESEPRITEDRLLPAPSPEGGIPKLNVGASDGASIKYDDLGPMVVNSDGTLSRITNWPKLTEPERERTIRVLAARNK
ncbi:hypothetical protein BV25DRAFT_1807934 [Artomyces pyxidatus]|uniref:Uncharacterized protein n=1 Tax=Artomyces pyxidatus TaxID=48021 RepID=A0ACB8SW68_9AGAM|nr:hypothetical protein BV25DRAFT_1807934 [Artomyces pyxidatus]